MDDGSPDPMERAWHRSALRVGWGFIAVAAILAVGTLASWPGPHTQTSVLTMPRLAALIIGTALFAVGSGSALLASRLSGDARKKRVRAAIWIGIVGAGFIIVGEVLAQIGH